MLTLRIQKNWQSSATFTHHYGVAKKEKDKSQSPTV